MAVKIEDYDDSESYMDEYDPWEIKNEISTTVATTTTPECQRVCRRVCRKTPKPVQTRKYLFGEKNNKAKF